MNGSRNIYASLTKLIVVEDEQEFECPAPVEESGENGVPCRRRSQRTRTVPRRRTAIDCAIPNDAASVRFSNTSRSCVFGMKSPISSIRPLRYFSAHCWQCSHQENRRRKWPCPSAWCFNHQWGSNHWRDWKVAFGRGPCSNPVSVHPLSIARDLFHRGLFLARMMLVRNAIKFRPLRSNATPFSALEQTSRNTESITFIQGKAGMP